MDLTDPTIPRQIRWILEPAHHPLEPLSASPHASLTSQRSP
ncbi:Hypothetical protein CAP_1818 [Chondromyces apiculatus DSM 436]|uniref:Uncharacterized protein n=1 Tax=Chondromyces apiculatus DSM 436 TaxID=1192034 RepID=A0A017TBM8_9BACT|nr:Hypothetical protein CAP_1818 [Chondromyces apiculatus DSM 436]